MRIYLSGPMTGIPDYNIPAFTEAAERLRRAGFEVVNPAENGLPHDAEWHRHMRVDIANMMTCEGLVTLPGWQASRGAKLECDIAVRLDMPVASVETVLAFQPWADPITGPVDAAESELLSVGASAPCPLCRSQQLETGDLVLGDGPAVAAIGQEEEIW